VVRYDVGVKMGNPRTDKDAACKKGDSDADDGSYGNNDDTFKPQQGDSAFEDGDSGSDDDDKEWFEDVKKKLEERLINNCHIWRRLCLAYAYMLRCETVVPK
jgi:hypothetical protein